MLLVVYTRFTSLTLFIVGNGKLLLGPVAKPPTRNPVILPVE